MGKPTSHKVQRERGKVRVDVYLEGDAARVFLQLVRGAVRVDVVSEAVLLLALREGIDPTKDMDDDDTMA